MTKIIFIIFFCLGLLLVGYKQVYIDAQIQKETVNSEEIEVFEGDILTLEERRVQDVEKDYIVLTSWEKIWTEDIEEKIKRRALYNFYVNEASEDYSLVYFEEKKNSKSTENIILTPLVGEIYLAKDYETNTGLDLFIDTSSVIGGLISLEEKIEFLKNKDKYGITAAEGERQNGIFYVKKIYFTDKKLLFTTKINKLNKEISELVEEEKNILKDLDKYHTRKEEEKIKEVFEDRYLEYTKRSSYYKNRAKIEEYYEVKRKKIYFEYYLQWGIEYRG